jgi:hypothetical protein
MVVTCARLPECNEGRIFDKFATANQHYFNSLEEMPVFTSRNFYSVCTAICTTKSYVAKRARSILCGYAKRELVAVQQPVNWTSPSILRSPEVLTESELVEADRELKALQFTLSR